MECEVFPLQNCGYMSRMCHTCAEIKFKETKHQIYDICKVELLQQIELFSYKFYITRMPLGLTIPLIHTEVIVPVFIAIILYT